MLFIFPAPNNYINFIKSQWVTFICLHLFFYHQIQEAYVILTFEWIITFAVVLARYRRVRANSQTVNFRREFGEEKQSLQSTETSPRLFAVCSRVLVLEKTGSSDVFGSFCKNTRSWTQELPKLVSPKSFPAFSSPW